MLPVLLAAFLVRPTHIPPIAQIMGIQVGLNGSSRLEKAFGQGKIETGGHSDSREDWNLSNPPSMLSANGWSSTAHEAQLVTELRWISFNTSDLSPKGSVPNSWGWLGKIYLGMPQSEALQIATRTVGKPQVHGDEYLWTQQGRSVPSDPGGGSPFEIWYAALRCARGKVKSIAVACSSYDRISAARADLAVLTSALQNFRLDCDRYPTTAEGLASLTAQPAHVEAWKGPYLAKPIGLDPWGHRYVYRYEGHDHFLLESYGSDGKPGGEGDAADIIETGN